MASLTSTIVLLLLEGLHFSFATAQNCYYPDGTISLGDTPCSSNGGMCCPYQWTCLSNGLCYLPNADYYGRYTCTDQTWQSASCPQFCTEGNTAIGDEAVLPCFSGAGAGGYCCDGDRVSFNCCTSLKPGSEYFALPDPQSVAYISTTYPATAAKVVTNSPYPSQIGVSSHAAAGSSSDAGSTVLSGSSVVLSFLFTSSQTSSSQKTSPTASTARPSSTTTAAIDQTAVTSSGVATSSPLARSTAQTTSASYTSASFPPNHSSSHVGLIVGLAVGVPLVLAILALAASLVLLNKRKRRLQANEISSRPHSPPIMANYTNVAPGTHAPEIDGWPVADTRAKVGVAGDRHSELPGSDAPLLYSPNPSVKTAPPQYSPQDGTAGSSGKSPEQPIELWGGFVPYRSPPTALPEHANTSSIIEKESEGS